VTGVVTLVIGEAEGGSRRRNRIAAARMPWAAIGESPLAVFKTGG